MTSRRIAMLLILVFVLIILVNVFTSCTKIDTQLNNSTITYTVKLKVSSEEAGTVYHIQVSRNGSSFENVDTINYNAGKQGIYLKDIVVDSSFHFFRAAIFQDTLKIYSDIQKP